MNKEGSMKIKNYRSGSVVRCVSTVLVCASIAGTIAFAPIIGGESLAGILYNWQEKNNLELRAKKALPIELEKGLKNGIVGLKFVYPDGKEDRIDFERYKKIYDINPQICENQVKVLYNSVIFPWDDCKIIEEDGVLMASPKVDKPELNTSKKIKKNNSINI